MILQKQKSQQAYQYLLQGKYEYAAELYEAIITEDTTDLQNYWYLGLTYLLQGNEDTAQLVWLIPMDQVSPQIVTDRSIELATILEAEVQRLETLGDFQASLSIREFILELSPENLENYLRFIDLSLEMNISITHRLNDNYLVGLLQNHSLDNINYSLLQKVLFKILDVSVLEPFIIELIKASYAYIPETEVLIDKMMMTAIKLRFKVGNLSLAADLVEICVALHSTSLEVLKQASCIVTDALRFERGIELAKQYLSLCTTTIDKVQGGYLLLRALLNAGIHGEEVWTIENQQKTWLAELVTTHPINLERRHAIALPCINFFFNYLQDQPQVHRTLQNQVARIAQQNLRTHANQPTVATRIISREHNKYFNQARTLKIGYIAHTLRKHSVGWLSRWFFQYHDRKKFHVSLYLVSQNIDEFTSSWFIDHADTSWCGSQRDEITTRILKDDIDILVDLDSYTLDVSVEVMALKPAPVQVTWLGADASGIPAIDYFIADPYVLPGDAQDYYQEKIWRLPQTYIAVDGFEIDVPTLRRDQLMIPTDAVIYLSAQTPLKRHPDTVRLQFKILKEVPNSYFLIKGCADQTTIRTLFSQCATNEGVNPNRLRFLENVTDESVHRANLAIADVILDTYPYNGATTTLEALWVGVPLVTKVGQQFAARNSYTFLTNAGITEGIAWTDEEYIEWGVRLGKDGALRQRVAQKLKVSRQTSPLWNTKQFTGEMEMAYQQMWQIYLKSIANK